MAWMARKAAADRPEITALDKVLKGMFKTLQSRPVPDRLRSVVDQLDEGEAAELKKTGRP
jgi:hypothetical protein